MLCSLQQYFTIIVLDHWFVFIYLFVCCVVHCSVSFSFSFHCCALKCAINSLLCRYSLFVCTSMYIFHIAKRVKVLHRHSCTMHVLMGLLRTSVHYMKYVNPFTFSPFPFCRQNESWISVHVLASHCWINISLFAWTKTSKYASEINGSNVFYCICDQLTLIRCTHMSSFRLIHWELSLYLLPKKKNEHSQ